MTDQPTDMSVNPVAMQDPALDEAAGQTTPEFHVGLTMAGAVSAGAYSAGAFDFLIEALSEWEKEKQQDRDVHVNPADRVVPDHDVFISVIAGASAGGITGSVGMISLAGGIDHRQDTIDNNQNESFSQSWQVSYTLPELYETWVKSPKLLHENSGDDKALLCHNDLSAETFQSEENVSLFSLLDSSVLTEIAHKSLRSAAKRRKALANKPNLSFPDQADPSVSDFDQSGWCALQNPVFWQSKWRALHGFAW